MNVAVNNFSLEIEAISRLVPRAFLIGLDRRRNEQPKLTIHTAFGGRDWLKRRQLIRMLADLGLEHRCVIRHCDFSKIARLQSLEDVVRIFAHAEMISDPTGCFVRAGQLVAFAKAFRAQTDKKVHGVYWDPVNKTIFIALDQQSYFADRRVKIKDLAATEELALRLLTDACGTGCTLYAPRMRLGFGIPHHKIVPVDARSFFDNRRFFPKLRVSALVKTTAALVGLGMAGPVTAVQAADYTSPGNALCAVSEFNGKAAIKGGFHDDDLSDSDGSVFATGSLSFPLGCAFGLQLDGAVGTLGSDDTAAGAGAHLFWRDPTVGLVGLIASTTHINRDDALVDDQTFSLIGGEGELYMDQFTIAAAAGFSFGQHIDDGGYASVDLRWYLTDNLMLTGGGEVSAERGGIGKVGIEFQPGFDGLPGLSLFADGAFGNDELSSAMVGLRYYFGSPKSLKDRQRFDDPVHNYAETNAYHPEVHVQTVTVPPGSLS